MSSQIHGSVTVNYSCIPSEWTGAGGVGNIYNAPKFLDADGEDDVAGTLDDDLRLRGDSPCIDAGDNEMLPADTEDLDEDGDIDEPIPYDLDENIRFDDDPNTPDTGNPAGGEPFVDMAGRMNCVSRDISVSSGRCSPGRGLVRRSPVERPRHLPTLGRD